MADIRSVIHAWFVSESGISRAVWAFQNQARPTRPFAYLRVFKPLGSSRGFRNQVMADADSPGDGLEIVGNSSIVVSMLVVGETGIDTTPQDALAAVQGSLHDDQLLLDLRQRQRETITVQTVLDNTAYTITVNDVVVTYTSGVGATAATIAAGLIAAINSVDTSKSWVGYIGTLTAEAGATTDELIIYGPDGIEYTMALDAKLSLDTHQGAVDLAYQQDYGINDLSLLLETKYEARAQMDVKFSLSVRRFRASDTILEAEIDVNGVTGTVPAPAP